MTKAPLAATPSFETSLLPAGARLDVDLAALEANWRDLGRRAAGAECAAVVKADAYGTGLERTVERLSRAGCRTFFAALPSEAIRARRVAPKAVVYVLNGLLPGDVDGLAAADLRPVLGSIEEAEIWAAAGARAGRRLPAAVHVDTGMNRLGFRPEEAAAFAARADLLTAIDVTLLMSHLASADEPGHPLNHAQHARFLAARALFPGVPASLANSSGVFLGSDWHFDLVRPGVALYGGAVRAGEPSPMRPVVRLEAPITRIRRVPAGETVGYGAAETMRRDSMLAVVSVGYADGYHRAASSMDGRAGGFGAIHGQSVPIVGRVSMDLTIFDVTEIAEVARGKPIELIGPHVPLQSVAGAMGTIDYEVLTSLGKRYERHYWDA